MPGSSHGSLGQVASKNIVRQNGSLTMVKKAPPSATMAPRHLTSGMSSSSNNNNDRRLMALAARGSIASAWQDSRANLLEKPERHSPDGQAATDHQARQMSAYRRWLSRNNNTNKVGQKQGGDRPFNSRYQPKYRESPGAAAILYLGIGMILVGLVFTFVGLGDKVFHTLELQLIGPFLIIMGFVVCGIRILICACANKCSHCDRVISAKNSSRRQSVDPSDDSWRPDSWNSKERQRSLSTSVIDRRPPTPARVTLERDSDSAITSSSSFQDIDDPRDLLSLRSEDSSDFSLSEFQEIELQKAPPTEQEMAWEGREVAVGNSSQDARNQGQDVKSKEQETMMKEQDVFNKGQGGVRKGQDATMTNAWEAITKEQDMSQTAQEVEELVHGKSNRAIGKLEKKLSDGLILNVSALQEASGSSVRPVTP